MRSLIFAISDKLNAQAAMQKRLTYALGLDFPLYELWIHNIKSYETINSYGNLIFPTLKVMDS